jgi:hypothetical protein
MDFESNLVRSEFGKSTIRQSTGPTTGEESMRRVLAVLIHCLTAVQGLMVFSALTRPAYAYADPGSGLLAFQIISTTFAGMIFILRSRLRTLLRNMRIRSEPKRRRAE